MQEPSVDLSKALELEASMGVGGPKVNSKPEKKKQGNAEKDGKPN